MPFFTKKPITIEAIQWLGHNVSEVSAFMGKKATTELESETAYLAGKGAPIFSVLIETLEGVMKAMSGDWIIKGIKGEFYPCKNEIFVASYDSKKEIRESAYGESWDDFHSNADKHFSDRHVELPAQEVIISQGLNRIIQERWRQISEEKYDASHDDGHDNSELAMMAACYCAPYKIYVQDTQEINKVSFVDPFPFATKYDKRFSYGETKFSGSNVLPNPDSYTPEEYIDLLTKAGALIAAQIDILCRFKERQLEIGTQNTVE